MPRMMLGQLLLEDGVIDGPALGLALRHQRSFGGRLGDVLVALGLLDEDRLVEVLGRQLGLPVAQVADRTVAAEVLRLLPERLLRRHQALPIWISQRRLLVAMSDPQDLAAIDELRFAAGMPLRVALAGKRAIAKALDRNFGCASRASFEEAIEFEDVDAGPLQLTDVRDHRAYRGVP